MATSIFINTDEAIRQHIALFSEAGKALSSWASVEIQLQQTFKIALEARNDAASGAVFRAAINANARLAMTDQAVTHCLNDIHESELLAEWKKLNNRAQKLAKRRNAIAHSHAVYVTDLPNKDGVSYGIGARLVDPLSPSEFPPNPQKQLVEGISETQLKDLQTRFHKLGFDLFQHGQAIRLSLARFRESQKS